MIKKENGERLLDNKIRIKYFEKLIRGEITAEEPCNIAATVHGKCSIGFLSYIGRGSEIYNADIGRFCSIAPGCFLGPTNHPLDRISTHLFSFNNVGPFKGDPDLNKWLRQEKYDGNDAPVIVGNDCWIGRNVTIRRGIVIGDGAVIGAGSVVVRDVPPYAIVGGIPARIIRFRFDDLTIADLLRVKWWEYQIDKIEFPDLQIKEISKSISEIDALRVAGYLKKLAPAKFIIKSDGFRAL
ncbi:MAG: CatB-related O-acetyltransferase [Stagnimonas sp.]|nr:CatB-related O-acetyltransferase [Stagnimonas sp.]